MLRFQRSNAPMHTLRHEYHAVLLIVGLAVSVNMLCADEFVLPGQFGPTPAGPPIAPPPPPLNYNPPQNNSTPLPISQSASMSPEPTSEAVSANWFARCRPGWFSRWWKPSDSQLDPPLGDAIYGAFRPQVQHGFAAMMTLYDYDFTAAGRLTPRGWQQVQKISRLAEQSPAPVLVQGSGNERIDAIRRTEVAEQSQRMGTPIAMQRIVIGVPQAIGLQGEESTAVYTTLIRQTQTGGKPSTASAPVSNTTGSGTSNSNNTSNSNAINSSGT